MIFQGSLVILDKINLGVEASTSPAYPNMKSCPQEKRVITPVWVWSGGGVELQLMIQASRGRS